MLKKDPSTSWPRPAVVTTVVGDIFFPTQPNTSEFAYDIVVYPLGALIIFSNLLGLVYMILAKYLRHPAYHYVASLAFADTGLGVYLIVSNSTQEPVESHSICLLKISFIVMLCTISIFSILFIAVDRYIFLVHAVHYYRWVTFRCSVQLLLALWIFATLIGFVPMMGWENRSPSDSKCNFMNVAAKGYIFSIIIVYFTGPMLVIIILYGRILRLAIQQKRRLLQQTQPLDHLVNPRGSLYHRSGIALLRGVRAARIVIVVVGVFLVTWMPFFIASFVQIICGPGCQWASTISTYLSLLGFFNSFLNPCIYAYFGLELRNESCSRCARRLLCCLRPNRIEPQIA